MIDKKKKKSTKYHQFLLNKKPFSGKNLPQKNINIRTKTSIYLITKKPYWPGKINDINNDARNRTPVARMKNQWRKLNPCTMAAVDYGNQPVCIPAVPEYLPFTY